jgi:carbamoyl-phosphate synthase large subunit
MLPSFLVIAGFTLVVAAVAWRAILLGWTARRLRIALTDRDPMQRAAAVEVATGQGLTRHAGALLDVVRNDDDPRVLAAVSEAVRRNVWEPGDSRKVVELRLWADRWGRGEEEPAPSAPEQTMAMPVAAAREAAEPATNAMPASPEPAAFFEDVIADALDDADTPRVTVLVTGAGGPAGVNVVRALSSAGHRVVAVDADPLAAGMHLAHASAVVPPADDAAFAGALIDVARREGADALISTISEEMLVLSQRADEFSSDVAIWVPGTQALENSLDKWAFACLMREAGIRIPPTTLGTANGVPGPWVVKPRRSRGSRGVRYLDTEQDVAAALRESDDVIVQTRLRGREFTVDALVSRRGELVGAVPRWRLETKAGISTKGQTFSDDRVLAAVADVLAALRLRGAANVQGFVDGPDVWILEVNPRFSGGLPLSLRAGADLVGEYLRGVLGLDMRCERLRYTSGTTMIRHFEEVYA